MNKVLIYIVVDIFTTDNNTVLIPKCLEGSQEAS